MGKSTEGGSKTLSARERGQLTNWQKLKSKAIKFGAAASIIAVLASCGGPKSNTELRGDLKDAKKELLENKQELSDAIAEYEAFKKNDVYYNDEAKRVKKILGGTLSGEQRDDLEEQYETILEKLEELNKKSSENEEDRREIQEEINTLTAKITELEKQLGTNSGGTEPTSAVPPPRVFQ